MGGPGNLVQDPQLGIHSKEWPARGVLLISLYTWTGAVTNASTTPARRDVLYCFLARTHPIQRKQVMAEARWSRIERRFHKSRDSAALHPHVNFNRYKQYKQSFVSGTHNAKPFKNRRGCEPTLNGTIDSTGAVRIQ